jgi:hypothetical protein
MLGFRCAMNRSGKKVVGRRATPAVLEVLEDRLLLYATLGDQWTYGSRITYSFMPDGTSVGGVPSGLFQTLNSMAATGTWQQQLEQAAAIWENVTNINLALVPDGGQPAGTSGNQQDDSRFGDIRIGAVPLPSSILAQTFLPPPANGGTVAGDIILNSTVNWRINSNYDLMTVAAHEFGHALGLGHSSVSTAVMYGTYNGIKQALASDDSAGIQSIYGTRQFDQFNTGGLRNNTLFSATNIASYINGSAQIAIPSLDLTTCGQTEWYTVSVPSSTTGTMAVTVQSSNLSSLAPKLQVFNSSLTLLGTSASSALGATISVNVSNVQAGQQYYYKVLAAGGPGPIGSYGLLVNFGSQWQSPIPPPNTVVLQQPDQGAGVMNDSQTKVGSIGDLTDWVDVWSTSPGSNDGPGGAGQQGDASAAARVASAAEAPAPGAAIATPGSAPLQAAALPADVDLARGLLQALDGALEQWTSAKMN